MKTIKPGLNHFYIIYKYERVKIIDQLINHEISRSSLKKDAISHIIFPCSGQANTGQISNEAAIRLSEEGYGSFLCTALLASQPDFILKKIGEKDEVIILDGCKMACTKKIVEKSGIAIKKHIIITDLGIEKKSGHRIYDIKEVEMVMDEIKENE